MVKNKNVQSMQNKQITINMPLLHFWNLDVLGKVEWYHLQLWIGKQIQEYYCNTQNKNSCIYNTTILLSKNENWEQKIHL
jgi:hypothetical protein